MLKNLRKRNMGQADRPTGLQKISPDETENEEKCSKLLSHTHKILKSALIYPQRAQKCKKSKVGQTNRPTDRPTDQPTDRHSDLQSRVHATKNPNAAHMIQMAVLSFLLVQKLKKLKGNESCLKELQNETNPIILAQFVWQQH